MAGSYNHAVDKFGRLHNQVNMTIATETQGDAYETIEEMYGMIWFLADGDRDRVEAAQGHWRHAINEMSPGRQPE